MMYRHGSINLLLSTTTAVVLAVGLAVMSTPAYSQSLQVLHSFTGGSAGENPWAGVAVDRAGNLYGTTLNGGGEYGDVFKLSRAGSGWVLTPLYNFQGDEDGAGPYAGVTVGPDGNLYGATYLGGITDTCCGTIFKLHPPATFCHSVLCPWTETVLYRFQAGNDGSLPYGGIIFDRAGNIYGTTQAGGGTGCNGDGCGTVFKLTPSQGQWTESILYRFGDNGDANGPLSSLAMDQAGNLYGTTPGGGALGFGAVYELSPSGSGWTERVLYSFQNAADGRLPIGGVVLDGNGNLFGGAYLGGSGYGGTVYELTPSGGDWQFQLLYSFVSFGQNGGPYGPLAINSAGTLYGTTYAGGVGVGSVFKVELVNGQWVETDLNAFHHTDGSAAYGGAALDVHGNVYGTTRYGGSSRNCNGGCGVVWEVPQ